MHGNRMMMPTMPVMIEPIGHVLLDSADQGTRMTTQCSTLQMQQSDVLNYRNDILAGSHLASCLSPNGWTCIDPHMTEADEGNVANAMVAGAQPLMEGLNLVRFYCTNGTVGNFSVGFSNEAKYGSSWGMNGVMINYNGNLCGAGLYKEGFCAPLNAGSLIDLFVEVQGFSVQVYVVIDGQPQGLAYWLDFSSNPGLVQSLRPAVQFCNGARDGKFFVVTHMPSAHVPAEGEWRGNMSNHCTENPFVC